MSFLQKVNSKVNRINSYLNKYVESNLFEKNLKESLNSKNYGVANSVLYDLSISTYDVNYYKRVVEEVFKAIQEKPSKWRRIYKGLRLCEYVMKNGCEYFICEVKQKEELITKLTYFTYLEDLRDKGAGIRELSANVIKLLKDNKYLEKERKEAAMRTKKYTHIESKPFKTKKSFFARRREKRDNLKQTKSEQHLNEQSESQYNRGIRSESILDEIIKERNLIHDEAKRLNSYQHSKDNRRVNSPRRSYLESSSKSSFILSDSESERRRNRSGETEKKKRRKRKQSRRRKRSDSSSRMSRSSSNSYSNYSSNASEALSTSNLNSSSYAYSNSSRHSSSHSSGFCRSYRERRSHTNSSGEHFSSRRSSPRKLSSAGPSTSESSYSVSMSLSNRAPMSDSLHSSSDSSLSKRTIRSNFSKSPSSRSRRRHRKR